MPRILWDPARQVWYSPDLSDGNIANLIMDGSDWPVSGDKIARASATAGLIGIVDWASMEDD